jgi:hypothetical protein
MIKTLNLILSKPIIRSNFKLFTENLDLIKTLSYGNPVSYQNNSPIYKKNSSQSLNYKKLRKLVFNRDEMELSFQLIRKAKADNDYTLFYSGYVFIEIKEKQINPTKTDFNIPRWIIANIYNISKILLIQPRCYINEDLLEKIAIGNKGKILTIEQTISNTYCFNLKVPNPNTLDNIVSSTIEIYPADMVILQIYLEV